MQIEFNTSTKTVTITEMKVSELSRITDLIKQICKDDKDWKIVSKTVWTNGSPYTYVNPFVGGATTGTPVNWDTFTTCDNNLTANTNEKY